MFPGAWWSQCGCTSSMGPAGGGAEGEQGGVAQSVEGFAETVDVIAWWLRPCRPTRTIFELLGAGEGAIDGVIRFAGLALCAALGTYVEGRTADGRFERGLTDGRRCGYDARDEHLLLIEIGGIVRAR